MPEPTDASSTPSRKGKTLLPGHGLMYEGQAMYGKRGRCWCGAQSEELPTAAARRRWHNAHKDEIRAAASASSTPADDGYRTPTGFDEDWARHQVRQIIDSYTLTMVGTDTQPCIDACADDVMHVLLGWPVTYKTSASADEAVRDA